MTNPNDPAFTVHPLCTNGLTKRELFTLEFMKSYLASPKFQFEELADYATKAGHACNALISELNKEPKP